MVVALVKKYMEKLLLEIQDKLKELALVEFGYPLGYNGIHQRVSDEYLVKLLKRTGIPRSSDLAQFYALCDGISMPDVHVGYFLHPIETVLRGLDRGEPEFITGVISRKIVVIGSDGGGSAFAYDKDDLSSIIYMPLGPVYDGVYDDEDAQVRIIANGYIEFLERLLQDVINDLHDTQGYRFIV